MNSPDAVARCRKAIENSCLKYMSDIDLFSKQSFLGVVPTVRYVSKLYLALPAKYVIVVERPYNSDIHSEVFSAMSYDHRKSKITPSVLGLSVDIATNCGIPEDRVEAWFRESWRYLNSGVIVVNVMCTEKFDTPHGATEKACFQKLLRDILLVSGIISSEQIHIIPMGKPAEYTVNSVLTSMGKHRTSVIKHRYPNPGIVSHKPGCDNVSQGFTLGHKATSRILCKAILRTDSFSKLDTGDFEYNMENWSKEVDDSTSAMVGSVDALDKLFVELRVEQGEVSIGEALAEFKRDLFRFRVVMLRAMSHMAIDDAKIRNSAGKSADWGQRDRFQKATPSAVSSSIVSAPTSSTIRLPSVNARNIVMASSDEEDEVEAPPAPPKPKVKPKTNLPPGRPPLPPGNRPQASASASRSASTPMRPAQKAGSATGASPLGQPPRNRAVSNRPGLPPPLPVEPPKTQSDAPVASAVVENKAVNLNRDQCNALLSLSCSLADGQFSHHSSRSSAIAEAIDKKSTEDGWIIGLCKAVDSDVKSEYVLDVGVGAEEGDASMMAVRKYLDSGNGTGVPL